MKIMEKLSNLLKGIKPPKSEFERVCDELNRLYEKKNADYGGQKGESVAQEMYARYGDQYFVMMIHQKAARVERLQGAEGCYFECLEDSYRDIANYAILALIAHEQNL